MKFVIESATQEDINTIFMHLLKRQVGIILCDTCGHVYIEPDTITDLLFIASVLKCDILIKPNSFQHGDKRYSILKIVREENENSRN